MEWGSTGQTGRVVCPPQLLGMMKEATSALAPDTSAWTHPGSGLKAAGTSVDPLSTCKPRPSSASSSGATPPTRRSAGELTPQCKSDALLSVVFKEVDS